MDVDGPAGAEAAAVYFIQLDSYMQATGDTAEFEAMSHSACEFCSERLEQARQIAGLGATFVGGEMAVEILHTYAQDPVTGVWPIDVRVREEPTTVTLPDGEVIFEQERGSFTGTIGLGQRDGDWVVVGLGDTKSD